MRDALVLCRAFVDHHVGAQVQNFLASDEFCAHGAKLGLQLGRHLPQVLGMAFLLLGEAIVLLELLLGQTDLNLSGTGYVKDKRPLIVSIRISCSGDCSVSSTGVTTCLTQGKETIKIYRKVSVLSWWLVFASIYNLGARRVISHVSLNC
jgi:hypothetical protein